MKRLAQLVAVLLLFCSGVRAQVKTTISDTVYTPTGGLANGTVRITNPLGFTAADGTVVAANGVVTTTVSAGALSVQLIPTVGSNPLGVYYLATYNLSGAVYTETWLVPVSGSAVKLISVRAQVLPYLGLTASFDQLNPPFNCLANQIPEWLAPGWGCFTPSGTGTVTSVALTAPSWLTVTGSPVTTNGTLGIAATPGQASHQVIGTCGATTSFAPCALTSSDLPAIALPNTPLTTNGDVMTVVSGSLARLGQGANGTFLGVSGGALGYYTPLGQPSSGAQGIVQASNGSGGFQTTALVDNGTTVATNENASYFGPNPYADLTTHGLRSVVPNATPAISGITVTITSGTNSAAISSNACASQSGGVCFKQGDGVVLVNAGPSQGMTVPGSIVVTPYNNRVGTGTGDGVAAPSGATTYNYKLFACDTGGGCTAASSATSTTTGASAIGAQSIAVSSVTRANNVDTFNTASQPAFSVGTIVHVDGCSTADNSNGFNGWFAVTAVNSNNFQASGITLDTRNGAATASAGGCTANWWNYNRITFTTSGSAAYRYFACSDRQTPGTYHLIAPSLVPVDPNNNGTGSGNLEIDDFGQTMMAASVNAMPWYLADANCGLGSGTNDNLVTTITAVNGTTLTLANNAGANASGAAIRFDSTPVVKAAITTTGTYELPIPPAGTAWVFNSFANLGAALLWLPAGLTANDTVYLTSNARLYGDRLSSNASSDQFQIQPNPIMSFSVSPGLFFSTGSTCSLVGLDVHGPGNGIAVEVNGGGGNLGCNLDYDTIFTNGGSTDYMGIALLAQGVFQSHRMTIGAGSQGMTDQSFTPSLFVDQAGEDGIGDLMGSARPILIRAGGPGTTFRIGHMHWQAATAPVITLTGPPGGGVAGGTIELGDAGPIIEDTIGHALFACLPGAGSASVFLNLHNFLNGPGSGINAVTGSACAAVNIPVTGQNVQVGVNTFSSLTVQGGSIVASGTAGPVNVTNFTTTLANGMQMVPPTSAAGLALSTGGSVPTGNVTYQIAWVDAVGNVTNLGPSATINVTSGNQTVTITPPTAPAGAVGYAVFRGGVFLLNNVGTCTGPYSVVGLGTFVDTRASACGQNSPQFNAALSSGASATSLFGSSLVIVGGGFPDTISGTFTAARTQTLPDLAGTFVLTPWNSFIDVAEIAAPANPASGNERWYANSSTHQFSCLTSGGANCAPTGGGGGVTSLTGDGALITNSGSTGAVTLTLGNTGLAYGVWGNITASSGAPAYHSMSSYPLAAFPTFNQNTTGTAAGLTGCSVTSNGDLCVYTGSAWTRLPANTSGSGVLNETSAGNPSWFSLTTLGDVPYGGSSGAWTRLAGPTTPNGVTQIFCDTPSGGAAVAPAWCLQGVPTNPQTTSPYTVAVTDRLSYLSFSSASAFAVTLPQAGTSGFTQNFAFTACAIGAGTVTITPTTSTISYTNGTSYTSAATSLALLTGQCAWVYSDNTNYFAVVRGGVTGPASATSGDLASFNGTVGNVIQDSGIAAANVTQNTVTGTTNALAKFTAAHTIANSDLQEAANLLNNLTSTQSWTVSGGQDASANSVLGSLTVRGANETGTGGATSAGGALLLEGGTNAATNAASQGGSVELLPGASTGSTQGLQGLLVQVAVYVKGGGTSTQWNLQCGTGAAMTVNDCAASPNNWLGIAEAVNANTVQVSTDGEVPINANAAVTLNHTVCAGSTAGKVTDSGGTATCSNSQGSTVGVVVATSGTWTLPDGTSFTASTTLPLVQLNTAANINTAGGGSGTVNNCSTVGAIAYYAATGTAVSCPTGTTINSAGLLLTYDGLTLVNLGVPADLGTSDITAQSTSQSAVTLLSGPTAGHYFVKYYADLNTPCTTGANSVSFTFNWTDASNARTLSTGSLSLGSAQSTSSYLEGWLDVWVGSGNVTYTSTVAGSCATGSSSYDVHAEAFRTK